MKRIGGAFIGAMIGVMALAALGWDFGQYHDKSRLDLKSAESGAFWTRTALTQFSLPAAAIGALIGFAVAGKK